MMNQGRIRFGQLICVVSGDNFVVFRAAGYESLAPAVVKVVSVNQPTFYPNQLFPEAQILEAMDAFKQKYGVSLCN